MSGGRDRQNQTFPVQGKEHPDEHPDSVRELEDSVSAELKNLTDEYHSIVIPKDLEESVLHAVKQGKEEGRELQNNMARRILMRTGQTAAAALLAITVLANSGATIAYAMERIPVIGAITKVVTFRTYEKKEEGYEAKIQVPQVEPESGANMSQAVEQVNKSVKEYTDQIIAKFESDIGEMGQEAHESVYTDYEVVTDNDRLFTLRINTDQIMASGAQSVMIYNIDKKSDRILTLIDMFPAGTDYVQLLSGAVKEQMKAESAADENKVYFLDDGFDSDFKAIKEDQNFYINESGHMVLVFDEYEVAPGYMGVVEIEIPESVYLFK